MPIILGNIGRSGVTADKARHVHPYFKLLWPDSQLLWEIAKWGKGICRWHRSRNNEGRARATHVQQKLEQLLVFKKL